MDPCDSKIIEGLASWGHEQRILFHVLCICVALFILGILKSYFFFLFKIESTLIFFIAVQNIWLLKRGVKAVDSLFSLKRSIFNLSI